LCYGPKTMNSEHWGVNYGNNPLIILVLSSTAGYLHGDQLSYEIGMLYDRFYH